MWTNCEILTCWIVSYFRNSPIDFSRAITYGSVLLNIRKLMLLENLSKPLWISLRDQICEQVLFILRYLQSLPFWILALAKNMRSWMLFRLKEEICQWLLKKKKKKSLFSQPRENQITAKNLCSDFTPSFKQCWGKTIVVSHDCSSHHQV